MNKGKDLLKLSVLLLLTLGLFANLSLDAIQVRADYFTTYCYGRNITETKQMENLFKRLYAKNPSGIIIGPEDVLYNAGIERSEYNYSVLWNDKQGFLEAIQDERVICVAYGFTWNAISTYKNIFFNQAVQRLLQDRYELLQLGTFSVWLRK